MLLPTAMERAADFFRDADVAKVHWSLWEVDKQGRKTGRVIPGGILPEGNLRDIVIRDGPDAYLSPPTTGNAWSRKFLDKVFPVPEFEFKRHAEMYLVTLAPIFGTMKMIREPLGYYRVHGCNDYAGKTADEKNSRNLEIYDYRCLVLSKYLRDTGVSIDPGIWKKGNAHYIWMQRLHIAAEEIKALIPAGDAFILVDEDLWGDQWGGSEVIADRHAIPFLEQGGQYWGPPTDDATGIRELRRLRQAGATYIVFGWPAFWWLDYYAGLHHYLRSTYPCVLQNERLVVFDLCL